MPPGVTTTDRGVPEALAVLRTLFRDDFAREFAVTFWDGTRIGPLDGESFTLQVNAPYALRAAFAPPLDLSPGRAFVEKWIDFGGDVVAGVDAFMRALQRFPKPLVPLLAARLLRLPRAPRVAGDGASHLHGRPHSRRRDAAAIGFHYDQPIRFYETFLDPTLVYSCAYFEREDSTLEEAQLAKIDYVLRKLRVVPGDHLLDIGCGWGALLIRAAERFGAHAYGVTLSRSQRDEAERRIRERGLSARATAELRDYRDLEHRRFDKIVSIGMVEHVGRSKLGEYFTAAFRALRPGGLFLNHGIADEQQGRKGYRASGFIDRYVFPDGELVPVSESLFAAERVGFEVRDVENLREHYARTLRAWLANFERNATVAIEAAGERTVRIWKLYMAGSAQGFRSGRMGVFQALLAKPHDDGSVNVPPTRRGLYVT